jgi:hypothetical protein
MCTDPREAGYDMSTTSEKVFVPSATGLVYRTDWSATPASKSPDVGITTSCRFADVSLSSWRATSSSCRRSKSDSAFVPRTLSTVLRSSSALTIFL